MQIKIALLASAVLASAHWTTIITPPSVTAVPNANAGPATTDENITHGGLDWSSSDGDNSAVGQPETFANTHGTNQASGGLLTSLEDLLDGGKPNGLLSELLGDGNDDGLLSALLGPNGILTKLLGSNRSNGLLSGLLGSDGNGLTGVLKKLLDELTGPTAGPATPDRSAVISALQALTQANAPNANNPAGSSPNPAGNSPNPAGGPLPDLASYDDSSCSTGSKVSCCDTSSKTNGPLANILGGSCDLPQLLFANNHCAADEVFCCPTDQDGFLNLSASCVPITL